jgi:biotin synthase
MATTDFDRLLERAGEDGFSREAALDLLRRSREPALALRLFQTAAAVRDRVIGPDLWWSAGIGAVTPCRIEPRCTYCVAFTIRSFPREDLVAAVKAVAATGARYFHMVGGSRLDGYDDEMADLVEAARDASDMGIEVNLGPSFSREGVRRLKRLGVRGMTCSLESFNPEVFARAKPGDSLEARKRLVGICQDEGMPLRTMILNGLGESEADFIDHLYWVRDHTCIRRISFSRFQPHTGTVWTDHPRCSPWEVARRVAVARLLMPDRCLGLAAGNTLDDIPLWYAAGGGNQVLAVTVSLSQSNVKAQPGEDVVPVTERISLVSKVRQIGHVVGSLGRRIGAEPPPLPQ